jgi:hypothetical protein
MAEQSVNGVPRVSRGWLVRYVGILSAGFGALYLITKSRLLPGDAQAFVTFAMAGDPAAIHYGDFSHFLQLPLAHGIWRFLSLLGLSISMEHVMVGVSLAGTLAAIVFVGLIAGEILSSSAAAWVGALLFGVSLHAWTYWNGELYALAMGFVAAGLFSALRGRHALAGALWALALLSRTEMVLACPAFALAVWSAVPDGASWKEAARRMILLSVVAFVGSGLALALGSWAIGKWTDTASLIHWVSWSLEARQRDIMPRPEILRAAKGLLTAFTAGGHVWRDILTGRGAVEAAGFIAAAAASLVVFAATALFLAGSVTRPGPLLFALTWLVPFHVLLNWWFVPTVEKYHAGALPGLILLITAGLVTVASRFSRPLRCGFVAVYVVLCAGVNLFAAIRPMQVLARDTARAKVALETVDRESGGRAVFVACDDPKALVASRLPYLRLRSVWRGSVEEIQNHIEGWVQARLDEGKAAYLIDRWCRPEEWGTKWSKARFDMFYLERSFRLIPTRVTNIPVTEAVATNPFSWRRGDVARIVPRSQGDVTR